jgi:hypothetical protein
VIILTLLNIVFRLNSINRRVESHQTYDEAVENAIHSGQIKAIEETFGREVSKNNSMYIENTQSG